MDDGPAMSLRFATGGSSPVEAGSRDKVLPLRHWLIQGVRLMLARTRWERFPMSSPVPPASPEERAAIALRWIGTVALLSVILGFVVQSVILVIKLAGPAPGAGLVVDVASGVTWSVLVCTGLAIGLSITKRRPLLTGALAFCLAPVALAAAKASQKVLTGWLGVAEKDAVLALGTISMLRAAEYALLGWLLARLVIRGQDSPLPYLAVGCVAGLTFGGAITGLTWWVARDAGEPLRPAELAATVINEMVFPVGCALVIFLGQSVGRHIGARDGSPA